MSNRQFYDSGAKKAELADRADKEGRYQDAIDLYYQALQAFQVGLRHEKMPSTTCIITKHTEAYMRRIDQLKLLQKEHPEPPTSVLNHQKTSKTLKAGVVMTENDSTLDEEACSDSSSPAVTQLGEKQCVTWQDIIGLEKVKAILHQSVVLPREMPHIFEGNRQPVQSILLYGPPGTGKTQIARALAYESQMAFFVVTASDIINKYIGESERNTRQMFETVRQNRPCILFIDEIDALCKDRENSGDKTNTVQEFLTQMDGITNNLDGILFMGNTNAPWLLDHGIRRRFNKRIYVALPSIEERLALLCYYLAKNVNDIGTPIENEPLLMLVEQMTHYSGADIKELIRSAYEKTLQCITEATHFKPAKQGEEVVVIPCHSTDPSARPLLYSAIHDKSKIRAPALTMEMLQEAIRDCKPSVNEKDLEKYETWTRHYGENAT
jgi:vacuolar protein-sorting-associated protein 4